MTDIGEIKKCFIIMPIADTPGYDNGHFSRVYNHLIIPACQKAGYEPIRADDVTSSNFIVLDILKKIVECDLAICDLSGRNPNVMYELGLRQAFNKKTVLIKDNQSISPFDVQAFRYHEYNHSLRIDNVLEDIDAIAKAMTSTALAQDDINSVVQLLKIEPAVVGEKTKLSIEETVLFDAINQLSNKVDRLSTKDISVSEALAEATLEKMTLGEIISLNNGLSIAKGRDFMDAAGNYLGTFLKLEYNRDEKKSYVVFENKPGEITKHDRRNLDIFKVIVGPPF
ncbi:hypothetical protein PTR04_19390 [Serratia ureilytica]|uniref:hypothetical protein n=1 Tax=Serratia ureilytica TaxID=300181 RepID=UPI00313F1B55